MSWLAVAIAAAFASGPPAPADPQLPWIAGRVLTTEDVHVGLRPALEYGTSGPDRWWGAGATLQVTVRTPW